MPLLPRDEWHVNGDHARCANGARPFHGCHWRGAWPLLYDGVLRVRDVLLLLYDVLRFVGSYVFEG